MLWTEATHEGCHGIIPHAPTNQVTTLTMLDGEHVEHARDHLYKYARCTYLRSIVLNNSLLLDYLILESPSTTVTPSIPTCPLLITLRRNP